MITRLLLVLTTWFLSLMTTCTKTEDINTPKLEGEWKLTGVFLSDAKDTPCGSEINDHRPITLIIKLNSGTTYDLSGNSVVNTYGSTAVFSEYNTTTDRGSIKLNHLITTEKGASISLMNCENRYYQFLSSAEEYSIDDQGNLLIGKLKQPNSNPRDGGRYLIFEKK